MTSELEGFVAGYYDQAYRTACLILRNPAEAEDAVQDAFLRAWRFRSSARGGDSLAPWLYRVLVNTCYSRSRTQARRPVVGLHEDVAGTAFGPEDLAVAGDVATRVRAALHRLPEPLRIPVVLRYFAGLSERDIAKAIRRRPGTVKSRLHDARRRLAADSGLADLVEEAMK